MSFDFYFTISVCVCILLIFADNLVLSGRCTSVTYYTIINVGFFVLLYLEERSKPHSFRAFILLSNTNKQ